MDELRDILKNDLETTILPVGHRERFANRLNTELATKKIRMSALLWSTAASIVLFVGLTILAVSQKRMAGSAENVELTEAEQYFNYQIETKTNLLTTILPESNTQDVLQDIGEMDESIQALKTELKRNPDDDRVIEAIINAYLLKIETLDNLVNLLQKQV